MSRPTETSPEVEEMLAELAASMQVPKEISSIMKQSSDLNESPFDKLRRIYTKNMLTHADIAAIANVSIRTVNAWFSRPDAAMHRRVLPRHIHAIEAGLAAYIEKRGRPHI